MSLLVSVNILHIFLIIFYIAITIFITYILLNLRHRIIIRTFNFAKIDKNKKETLISLLMSSSKYLLFGIAILFILTLFIPLKQITPILAGAGVIGVAIGFGAQSLVKDIITGFFIMFEDQFHVGDFVEINNTITGTIEEMGLRMTTLREWSGKKFYIANSEIQTVRNYNREEMRAIIYATFPYHENPQKIRDILNEVCTETERCYGKYLLKDTFGRYEEPPQIYGVLDINDNERGGTFVITAKTKPLHIWAVEKIIKEAIWQKCYKNNVKLAYPRRVLEDAQVEMNHVSVSNEH